MSSNFSGSTPRAQSATLAARTQAETETNTFVGNNFSTVSPGTPVCSCAFASNPAHVAQAATLFGGSSISTKVSEKMGELGAIHVLKEMLEAQGKVFDPSLLHEFHGANNFNYVYFDAKPPNATTAIILEAKGGSSALGSRNGLQGMGRVKQGTSNYAKTIIKVMGSAKGTSPEAVKRVTVADQLEIISARQKAAAAAQPGVAQPPKILYLGVATKYNKPKKQVHDPVLIFATPIA